MIYDSECSGRCICVIGPRSPDLLSRHFCSDLEPSFRIRKKKKKKMANNLSIIITRYLLYPRCCLLITFNPSADPSSLLRFLPQCNRTTAFFFSFPLLPGSSVSAALSHAAAVIHLWQPPVSESLLFLLLCGSDVGRCLIYPRASAHNRPLVVVVVVAAAAAAVFVWFFLIPLFLYLLLDASVVPHGAGAISWDARIKALNSLRHANSLGGLFAKLPLSERSAEPLTAMHSVCPVRPRGRVSPRDRGGRCWMFWYRPDTEQIHGLYR